MAFRQDPKIQLTYGLESYGFELRQFLISKFTNDQITPALASAQYQQVLHGFNGVDYTPVLPHDIYMNADDTALVANSADSTAYTENFTLHSHATGHIAHLAIVAAFCDNVSAFTNGSVTMNSVTFTIRTWKDNVTPYDRYDIKSTPTTAFTALTATGAQILQVFEHLPSDVRLRTVDSQPITIDITVNETTSGTNTRQVGLMPSFPLSGVTPAGVAKVWTVPQVIMNIKPSIGSADFALRE